MTTLDPQFRVAYRFGAIFLTEAYPSGPGRPDLAIALLQRGHRGQSRLRGSTCTTSASSITGGCSDYKAAAHWFEQGGELPGAPAWLAPLAATTLAQGGDRQSSRLLWRQLRDTTDIDWFRQQRAACACRSSMRWMSSTN